MKNLANEKDLPLWIEVLFVQIGLPDSWLRKFLKSKRKAKRLIKENRGTLTTIIFMGLLFIYLSPLIKQASLNNNCITKSKDLVRRSLDSNNQFSEGDLQLIATSFCNGGDIL